MRKVEIIKIRSRESQLQQSFGILGYGNFYNLNQFQGGSQHIFNSSNFGSSLQFPSEFRGSNGYGGVPYYEISCENGGNVMDCRSDDN